MFLPSRVLGLDGSPPPSDLLGVAYVGIGGMGAYHVREEHPQHRVAFCDVNDASAENNRTLFPDVPYYRDYRRMLDRHDRDIDAVVVATPDHSHYRIAMEAVRRGKHVYVEKPMSHTLSQVRKLTLAAREHGVVTQMGNQGHSTAATRMAREWVQAGVIGPVRQVHAWTDRPIWPQGMQSLPEPEPVPGSLAWELWRGDVCDYGYHHAFLPFRWRGWYAFGCGALGDMGCHVLDPAFYALDLAGSCTVQATVRGASEIAFPSSSSVSYAFPARGDMPPVNLTWYEKGFAPPRPPELEEGRTMGGAYGGSLIVGDKATIMLDHHASYARIIPEIRMQEMRDELPPRTIPRI